MVIGQVLFLCFYRPQQNQGPLKLKEKNEITNYSAVFYHTFLSNKGFIWLTQITILARESGWFREAEWQTKNEQFQNEKWLIHIMDDCKSILVATNIWWRPMTNIIVNILNIFQWYSLLLMSGVWSGLLEFRTFSRMQSFCVLWW